ncbi:E3 ubiquitin-protein ligase RFWD3 [Capsicum annuum]|uniref:E3 ubiquitin-protein ligase RFWD3 n=1 Tax=Capsicum annuum TaxID=4072 RepID=UPI001FB162D2|nr:E3 ubiquitin-protein ligase RFWD3 [Capsicum annuum]
MSGDGSDETDDPDYQRFLHQFANAATGGGISSFIQFLQEEAGDEEEDEEYEPDDGEDEDDDEEEEEEVSGRTTLRRVLYGHRDHVSSINNNSVNLENSENSVVESGDVVIATMRNGKGGEEEAFRGGEKEGGGGGDEGEEWNRSEIDGLFCTICMEAWTNDGDHQICCLPCGHLYGLSCIKKWLLQKGSSAKCPQCNKKCTLKGIRVLYASQLHAVDEKLQKKIRSLEARCFSLEKECTDWCKKEIEWRRREAELHQQVEHLKERKIERSPIEMQTRSSGHFFGRNIDSKSERCVYANVLLLQKEFQIDGARLFDVDSNGDNLIIARRLSGMGGQHMLTKISLLPPHEREDILLPMSMKIIKDLHVSPHERVILLASLGKKLSVLSAENNHAVLTYDLPTAPWSCAWDVNNPHYMYAGLQNGMVLQFDRRQTMRPVESLTGLTGNPVHTVCSLSADPTLGAGVRSVLSASSVGLCHWNFASSDERPCLIPESENQGICISLACGDINDDIVATFRPRLEISGDMVGSQVLPTPGPTMEPTVEGSHVLYRRVGSRYQKLGASCARVSGIRLPKTAIIDGGNNNAMFASGDEATLELVLQDLPSLNVCQRIKSLNGPIRDVRYARLQNSGLLGCLSEDRLQLCTHKLQ